MNPTEQLQLQRLVDGECNDAEIYSLLAEADTNPANWRTIASAYVENMVWQKQFQQNTSNPAPTIFAVHATEDRLPGVINSELQGPTKITDLNLDRQIQFRRSPLAWFSLAASLLLAATFGYLVGKDGAVSTSTAPTLAENQFVVPNSLTANQSPTPIPKMTPASLKADYHLQLLDKDGKADTTVLNGEVPLYYVRSPEQWKQFNQVNENRMPVSPEMLQLLTGNGFQMRQDLNFISGNLKDGRSFVVPVRTINFSPGQ